MENRMGGLRRALYCRSRRSPARPSCPNRHCKLPMALESTSGVVGQQVVNPGHLGLLDDLSFLSFRSLGRFLGPGNSSLLAVLDMLIEGLGLGSEDRRAPSPLRQGNRPHRSYLPTRSLSTSGLIHRPYLHPLTMSPPHFRAVYLQAVPSVYFHPWASSSLGHP